MRVRLIEVIAVMALAGCGGGGGSANAVAGVHQTLHALAADLLKGDYKGACALMTMSAQAQLGGPSCPAELGQAIFLGGDPTQAVLILESTQSAHTPVKVRGSTATVAGTDGNHPTTFVKQGGRWLIQGGVGGS
jgi:hypothetical protein